jgi:hypothetical protein
MDRKKYMILTGILCCILSLSVYGEVFSFWPFHKSVPASIESADLLLHGEALREESVVINGIRTTMKISIMDADPMEAFRTLKRRYPDGIAAKNQNGLLFSTPPENGYVRKILIVSPDGIGKGVMFSMSVPVKGFGKHPVWPHSLPLPAGSEVLSVLQFPARNSVFGQFRSRMSREEVLSNIVMQLKADNWISPSKESGIAGASGEIMLSSDAKDVIIIGISPVKGSPYVQGSLYRRKLK